MVCWKAESIADWDSFRCSAAALAFAKLKPALATGTATEAMSATTLPPFFNTGAAAFPAAITGFASDAAVLPTATAPFPTAPATEPTAEPMLASALPTAVPAAILYFFN